MGRSFKENGITGISREPLRVPSNCGARGVDATLGLGVSGLEQDAGRFPQPAKPRHRPTLRGRP